MYNSDWNVHFSRIESLQMPSFWWFSLLHCLYEPIILMFVLLFLIKCWKPFTFLFEVNKFLTLKHFESLSFNNILSEYLWNRFLTASLLRYLYLSLHQKFADRNWGKQTFQWSQHRHVLWIFLYILQTLGVIQSYFTIMFLVSSINVL